MNPPGPFQLVGNFLESRRDAIISQWLTAIRRDPGIPSADDLPRHELLDHLPAMLASLSQQLRGLDSGRQAERQSQVHGEYRWNQNYTLAELLRELSILREILLAEFAGYFGQAGEPLSTDHRLAAHQCLHRFLDNEIAHSVSAFVDRQQGEIRAANESLRQLDFHRLQMLRTVAHELGNHLQGLAIITAVVQKEADWESASGHLAVLDESVRSMALLTQQLLEYAGLLSGKESAQLAECALAGLLGELADCLRALAAEKGLAFVVESNDAPASVRTDRRKLYRICANLGMNAIKYTDSGQVTLRFRAWKPGAWAIEVADTGPGIELAQRELIFQEFYRVPGVEEKRRGAGLGLAITARLARLLGAEIKLESEVGRGSLFRVILPLA